MSFFAAYRTGCVVMIKLTPNAAFCGFGGLFINADEQTYLKAYVTTAPEKGKANKELIKLLAKALQIPKQNIELLSGATNHLKKFFINVPLDENLTAKLNILTKEDAQ